MPHILVKHVGGNVDEATLTLLTATIDTALRAVAAQELSTSELTLTSQDFSISYQALDMEALTKHVEIVIWAHDFPERLERADPIAELICLAVIEALEAADTSWRHCGISVSLILAPIGYYAGTFGGKPTRRETDAYDLGQGTPGP